MRRCLVLSQSWLLVKRNCGERFRLGIITCTRVTLLPGSLATTTSANNMFIKLRSIIRYSIPQFNQKHLQFCSLHQIHCPQLGARVGLWAGQESHYPQQVSGQRTPLQSRAGNEPSRSFYSAWSPGEGPY